MLAERLASSGDYLSAAERQVIESVLAGMPADAELRRLNADRALSWTERRRLRAILDDPLLEVARRLSMRLQSAHWLLAALHVLGERGSGNMPIDQRTDCRREEFFGDYYYRNRALFLAGCAASWPAVHLWSRDYLKVKCPAATVEVMTNRTAARRQDQNTSAKLSRLQPWAEYVDSVFNSTGSNDFYVVSRNYAFENEDLSVLLSDVGVLPFVATNTPGKAVRMWFGPKGTVTPWHHDDRNNVIIELLGHKQVSLCPPFQVHRAQQAQMWYAGGETTESYTRAEVELDAVATTVELRRGDGLFIPVGWWHKVIALEPSLTLACVDFGEPNAYERKDWLGLKGL